tara:strand:- start:5133 stop:5600 length:468 start_codon:yes stop_codon:yes gene_type:complete
MSKIVKKRIEKEIKELSFLYIIHEVNIPSKNDNITLTIEHDNDIYVFEIPKYYPFKPPVLHLNGVNIITVLHNYQNFLLDIGVKKYTECICIKSLFCSNNWSPKLKIQDLVQEVQKEKWLIQEKYKTRFISPILLKNNIYETGILNTIISFYINI